MNFSGRSPEEFRGKIFTGEHFQPLIVLAVLCHLHGKLLVIHLSLAWIIHENVPLVIGGKSLRCPVAWKRKMLHDVTRHDVIAGHQAYIHRFMGPRILHLAKTVHGSRDAPALRDYKLASLAAFRRLLRENYLFIYFSDRSLNLRRASPGFRRRKWSNCLL